MRNSDVSEDENLQIPDVSAYTLEHALELIKACGAEKIKIDLTAPPRSRDAGYCGDSRVVAQKVAEDGTVELLVVNVGNL